MMKKAKRWARGLALASGLLAAAVLAGVRRGERSGG